MILLCNLYEVENVAVTLHFTTLYPLRGYSFDFVEVAYS